MRKGTPISCLGVLLTLVGVAVDVSIAFSPLQHGGRTPVSSSVVAVRRPPFPPTWTSRLRAINGDTSTLDEYLKENQLDKAVNYLAEHPDSVSLSDRPRWNALFDAVEETTAKADETENLRLAEQQQLAEFPLQSKARQDMTNLYSQLKKGGQLRLFGAVDAQLPLAAGSHKLSPKLLEEILDMPMSALTPQPTNTLLLAGVFVAVVEGLLSVALNIPLDVLALASLLAVTIDRLFVNGAVLESVVKLFSPGMEEKVVKHEAGHFLMAYLLGCPVEGIVLSAWAALQDRRFGARAGGVSAGTSFFDPQLSEQVNSNMSITRSALDRYSMIVMAGIAAEADNYGKADGGAGDELALVAFLSQLAGSNKAKGTKSSWTPEKIRNQARWGALQSVLLLREYKPAYDSLVETLQRGNASLGDCIFAIEDAARRHNLQPVKRPKGVLVDNLLGESEWRTTTTTSETEPARIEDLPAKPVDEEELMETLTKYKQSVEERLEELDKKISDI